MFALYAINKHRRGLEDAVLSVGIIDPHPPSDRLRLYDFGRDAFVDVDAGSIVSVAGTESVSYAPGIRVEWAEQKMAANPVVPLRRRRAQQVPTNFVSGYATYARSSALYWRRYKFGTQPALAAGVFALSTIRTSIYTAMKLFSHLTPHVLVDELPALGDLVQIVRDSGAGLDSPKSGRPAWFLQYEDYRNVLVEVRRSGLMDDELRRYLATKVDMPTGLGLAKLSFTLALLGANLACLDGRILDYAFTKSTRDRFNSIIRKSGKRYSDDVYGAYRSAELGILKDTPFYDPGDPVALARAQWMLWESLGPEGGRRHTHEELFRAILEPAWLL